MNPFKKFDKIYYINLDTRPDRKEHLFKELAKMDVGEDMLQRIPGVIHPMACLGCSIAHKNALLDCKKNGYSNYMIIEDDFTFKEDKETTFALLNKFWDTNHPWDIVMLSGNVVRTQPTPHTTIQFQ